MSPCSPSEATDARGEESPRHSSRSRWFVNQRGVRASGHGRSYRDRSGSRPPPSARCFRMADESHRGGLTVVDNRRASIVPAAAASNPAMGVHSFVRGRCCSTQSPPQARPAGVTLRRRIRSSCVAFARRIRDSVSKLVQNDRGARDRPPNAFQQCGSLGNIGRIGNFERRELSVFDHRRHECLNR